MAPTEIHNEQMDVADILWNNFYVYVESTVSRGEGIPMFRSDSGKLVLPTRADPEEMEGHRNYMIRKAFRFTWPDLPKGARYLQQE